MRDTKHGVEGSPQEIYEFRKLVYEFRKTTKAAEPKPKPQQPLPETKPGELKAVKTAEDISAEVEKIVELSQELRRQKQSPKFIEDIWVDHQNRPCNKLGARAELPAMLAFRYLCSVSPTHAVTYQQVHEFLGWKTYADYDGREGQGVAGHLVKKGLLVKDKLSYRLTPAGRRNRLYAGAQRVSAA